MAFNIHYHTGDEIEFHFKCKDCGMCSQDIEDSCIECSCDWFQSNFRDFEEEEENISPLPVSQG